MDVAIASTPADADSATAVEQHHAELAGSLAVMMEELLARTSGREDEAARLAQRDLVAWCREELVPHALAEEKAMYPAARALPEGRLLVDGMLGEHAVIDSLVEEVAEATDPVRAAAAARALQVLFEVHLSKENELIVPLLAAATDVSLSGILAGMHELLGATAHDDQDHAGSTSQSGCGGHSCSCGEVDPGDLPELDARFVPHAIRHATVFGALDAVRPGGGLVLVAPHDPLPLLAQIEKRAPGRYSIDYLERGPETWRLAFIRSF